MIYTRMLLRYLSHCEYWGKIPFIDDFINWAARTAALMRAPHPRQRRPATGSRHGFERNYHV